MSRYWPSATSVRIRLNSARAARLASRIGDPAQPRIEQLVAPDQQEVAEQQRRGRAELGGAAVPAGLTVGVREAAVGGGQAAPGVRVVDDVVVDECGRVEHLQRAGRQHDGAQVAGSRVAVGFGRWATCRAGDWDTPDTDCHPQ